MFVYVHNDEHPCFCFFLIIIMFVIFIIRFCSEYKMLKTMKNYIIMKQLYCKKFQTIMYYILNTEDMNTDVSNTEVMSKIFTSDFPFYVLAFFQFGFQDHVCQIILICCVFKDNTSGIYLKKYNVQCEVNHTFYRNNNINIIFNEF